MTYYLIVEAWMGLVLLCKKCYAAEGLIFFNIEVLRLLCVFGRSWRIQLCMVQNAFSKSTLVSTYLGGLKSLQRAQG